jgi:hypothetical protein
MTFHDHAALLGKRVRVKLDDNVVQEGQFLGFGDGGDFELLQDDGFVYHAWPMLSVEEVVTEDAAEETVRSPADAGEGSPEGEGGPGGEEDPGSDASG